MAAGAGAAVAAGAGMSVVEAVESDGVASEVAAAGTAAAAAALARAASWRLRRGVLDSLNCSGAPAGVSTGVLPWVLSSSSPLPAFAFWGLTVLEEPAFRKGASAPWGSTA